MKVLFITRKYPPQVGGMEQFSYGLIKNIQCDKSTVILNKKQIHLIWWLPYALVMGIIKSFGADIIHLGDAFLSPLGLIIKIISRKRVMVTVHGLDLTYKNWFYQKINIGALKYLDKIICVSASTKQECLKRGIDENKLIVIPNGIDVNCFAETKHAASLQKHKTLLTVGRLVKRKGVEWFIKEVMPKLYKNIKYLVVGTGPELENIITVIADDRVELLGRVSDEKLKELYNTADLFVMPNIKVKGDREGFGIVAIEAASVGLPVVASNIEGIKDAIIDKKNGFLVESKNIEQYVRTINLLLNSNLDNVKQQIKKYTVDNYSWDVVCEHYLKAFK